jgi:hypothetical protein
MNSYLDKVMLGFASFFMVFMTFTGGINVGEKHYVAGVTDLCLAIFFLAILGAVLLGKLNDLRDEIHAHHLDAMLEILKMVEKHVESVDKPTTTPKRAPHSKSEARRIKVMEDNKPETGKKG